MAKTEARVRQAIPREEVERRLPPVKPIRLVRLWLAASIAAALLVVGVVGGLFVPWGGKQTVEVPAPAAPAIGQEWALTSPRTMDALMYRLGPLADSFVGIHAQSGMLRGTGSPGTTAPTPSGQSGSPQQR